VKSNVFSCLLKEAREVAVGKHMYNSHTSLPPILRVATYD